jgi:hypothetical protein
VGASNDGPLVEITVGLLKHPINQDLQEIFLGEKGTFEVIMWLWHGSPNRVSYGLVWPS